MTDAPEQKMKAHCPSCNKETNCSIHGSFDQPWEVGDEENHSHGQIDHRLLQCLGCEMAFYHRKSWDSEDWDFYHDPRKGEDVMYYPSRTETFPTPTVKRNSTKWLEDLWWIDQPLYTILGEVYQASETKSYFLAAVGLRTALDRTMELLGVDPGHYLADKLKSVRERGHVSQDEHDILSVVADAGNAAAHQGWSPNQDQFKHLLLAIEQLVQRAIVVGSKALEVRNNIPAKQKRPRKKKAVSIENASVPVDLLADQTGGPKE